LGGLRHATLFQRFALAASRNTRQNGGSHTRLSRPARRSRRSPESYRPLPKVPRPAWFVPAPQAIDPFPLLLVHSVQYFTTGEISPCKRRRSRVESVTCDGP